MANSIILKLFQCAFLCLVMQPVLSNDRLAFLIRNSTDSFRITTYDCKKDPSVCSKRNAVCQPDGSCVCNTTTPDYADPKFSVNYGYLDYDSSDGCMTLTSIIDSIDTDNLRCTSSFGPYQVIPDHSTEELSVFRHSAGSLYSSCNFTGALVKYPGKKSWQRLTWLNASYVELFMIDPGYLVFGWNMAVPQLNGLMVVINVNCTKDVSSTRNQTISVSEQCLRAKVVGAVSSSLSLTPGHISIPFMTFLVLSYLSR